jgi:hypothetical protein
MGISSDNDLKIDLVCIFGLESRAYFTALQPSSIQRIAHMAAQIPTNWWRRYEARPRKMGEK